MRQIDELSMRRKMRLGLVAGGIADEEADESIDLAFCAAREALTSFTLAADRASDHAWSNAYGIGLQLLELAIGGALAEWNHEADKRGAEPGKIMLHLNLAETLQ
jgi:hypothetical protein